ncbi:spore protease YyaC [Bacillus sp. FJAT-47783]|uniref:spore protease YyaC n=1 Tax=Bacillus sp. FJAT-47783 TaxID=2922712 RepID=UPI001FAB4FC6|nr:spore protease YyaC [Bacillus sp. FJAT-47783]
MNRNLSFFSSEQGSQRVFHDSKDAVYEISNQIVHLLPKLNINSIVVLCIGTDRSTGDSLGPLVGSKLQQKKVENFYVYGTLKDPVHAVNLEEKIIHLTNIHRNPFIIAVDACLGRFKNVGTVQVGSGPVKPGAGVNKVLPEVGDIHITGIVNVSGFMEFFVLQNTRLHLVMSMADVIAESLFTASQAIEANKRIRKTQMYESNINL